MNEDDADRSRRVAGVLGRVLELEASARGTYLDRVCSDDVGLRQEIESLMRRATGANDLLERPAAVLRANPYSGKELPGATRRLAAFLRRHGRVSEAARPRAALAR
jgi:hypothetical protein